MLSSSCRNATINDQGQNELDDIIQGYHSDETFNGCVVIMKGEDILLNTSYGYADGSKLIPLEAHSKFGIGSIYKEFPAVSIMTLAEERLLNVKDRVSKYIPELPIWSEKVTIEQLLQYTSGLPRIDFGKYFGQGIAITDEDIWKDILNIQSPEFEPGTDYLYSNNGPFLLIKIVEKISGKTFQEFLEEKLLKPAHMYETVIKDQYPYVDDALMASPFDEDGQNDNYNIRSSNLLITSTALDLAKWARQLHGSELIGKSSLFYLSNPAVLQQEGMQAPLGDCVHVEGEIMEHTHHGSMGNYEGLIKRFNDSNITIVLLTNQKNGKVFEIAEKIRANLVVD